MNKNAIQKYAIWARNELIEQVKQRAYQYGISEKGYGDENAAVIAGRVLSPDEKRQRRSFVNEIKKSGYKQAVEEVAYTWFNRFVALRYMEVNDFLPTHIRVFSDTNGNFKPEILTSVLHLDLPGLDKAKVSDLLNANATEELYRYLLLTQCNALNALLPEMFERMGAYTEILLPNNILKPESVIGRLVKDIPEEDFRDAVQIIGWLYQYYNTEPKQAVFDGLKKNIKITKENIPAATQLFTPDWIVRYMVENSLGRLWLEHCRAESGLSDEYMNASYYGWKYYIEEAEQEPQVKAQLQNIRAEYKDLKPEDIKVIDPCMGSGHILVYAFDVLMQIYTSEGYSERDAAKLILEKNLYGLELDRRAYQLAYFALMMKARQYNRRIFTEGATPQVYYPSGNSELEEFGSLLKIDKPTPKPEFSELITLFESGYEEKMHVWNFNRLLSQKYHVVLTNPPYRGASDIATRLASFLKNEYPDSKSDLFSAFIERCAEFTKLNGYCSMVTMQSWMFLSSYEMLRKRIIGINTISSLVHIGYNSFPDINSKVAQAAAFTIFNNGIQGYYGSYLDLTYKYPQAFDKEKAYFHEIQHPYIVCKDNFAKIPGSPVAYWVGAAILRAFGSGKPLKDLAEPRQGIATADNNRFLRQWFEVNINKIGFGFVPEEVKESGLKWFPYNKGGEFRKYYGNNDYVANWEFGGSEMRAFPGSVIRNPNHQFRQSITWSKISSGSIAFRFKPIGHLFDVAGTSIFAPNGMQMYLLGFCNSCVALAVANVLSPTLNYEVGHIASFPIIGYEDNKETVYPLVTTNISLSRSDWDAFETSWDFKRHPLI